MQRKYYHILVILLIFSAISCSEDKNNMMLQNDCIKRSEGPNVIGADIEFAYAMALPPSAGKIVSARVEATIPGAPATRLENKSYYTDKSGTDVGITIGEPSTNSSNNTEVVFTKDTCAATLRYYYRVPEDARGKSVSFTFSVVGSNGETVLYQMGPYTVSAMDMKLDMAVSDNNLCYLSLEDMTVYNATDAAANPNKIDLVYLYRSIAGITFAHAFVSPGADPEYLPGITLPAGITKKSKLKKAWNLQDRQLARIQYGIYIDDLDFIKADMKDMPDFALNMKAEAGLWVETEDGKYRAYIYVNSVNNSGKSAVVSIKRYAM